MVNSPEVGVDPGQLGGVLPATEERKEAGERRRTMTETQRVKLAVNSTFPWVVRSAVQYSTV